MPYELRGNCVYKLPNTLLKCHDDKGGAMSHLAALRLNVSEAHQEEHISAIIALFVPLDVAEKIALPGFIPPEELHVTLAFLGELGQIDNPDMLKGVVAEFAKMTDPLRGRINSLGRFVETEGDEHAIYVGPDLKDLASFRQSLVHQLERMELAMPSEHGFTPHITLAYIHENDPFPVETINPISVSFNTISVILGNERTDYGLGRHIVMSESQRESISLWLKRNGNES